MMERRCGVEGLAVKLSVTEALAYFITRPLESRSAGRLGLATESAYKFAQFVASAISRDERKIQAG